MKLLHTRKKKSSGSWRRCRTQRNVEQTNVNANTGRIEREREGVKERENFLRFDVTQTDRRDGWSKGSRLRSKLNPGDGIITAEKHFEDGQTHTRAHKHTHKHTGTHTPVWISQLIVNHTIECENSESVLTAAHSHQSHSVEGNKVLTFLRVCVSSNTKKEKCFWGY